MHVCYVVAAIAISFNAAFLLASLYVRRDTRRMIQDVKASHQRAFEAAGKGHLLRVIDHHSKEVS